MSTGADNPEETRTKRGGTRPDPAGMKRTSLYVTQEAAGALDDAAKEILATLDHDVPRHAVLSALLLAGAERADDVARELAEQRTEELTARLAALRERSGQHTGED